MKLSAVGFISVWYQQEEWLFTLHLSANRATILFVNYEYTQYISQHNSLKKAEAIRKGSGNGNMSYLLFCQDSDGNIDPFKMELRLKWGTNYILLADTVKLRKPMVASIMSHTTAYMKRFLFLTLYLTSCLNKKTNWAHLRVNVRK